MLTSRERAILDLLGHRLVEPAHCPGVAPVLPTVRTHTQNLLLKLGVHSQLEAARFAVEHGFVAALRTVAGERHST